MSKKSRRKENVARSRVIEAREARERQRQRKYWIAAGVVAAVLLLILAAGAIDRFFIQPSRPIAVVEDKQISTGTFQKYVRLLRADAAARYLTAQQQLQQIGNDPTLAQFKQVIERNAQQAALDRDTASTRALDALVETELIKMEAAQRGITVSDQELQAEVERQIAGNKSWVTAPQATAQAASAITATATAKAQPTATPTVTPTPAATVTATTPITTVETPEPTPTPPHVITPDEFRLEYQNLLTNYDRTAGFSEAEYRELVRNDLVRRKLQDIYAAAVPTATQQVRVRHILLEKKEDAESALQRLKQGESFEALAKELSKDPGSQALGGDLGWFPRAQMVKPFEDAAFALQPNQLSEIVSTQFGFHILQLIEGPVVRPLDDSALRAKQNSALRDWLTERRNKLTAEGKIVSYYSPSKDPR